MGSAWRHLFDSTGLYIKAVSVIGGALVPVLVNLTTDYARLAATVVSLAVVILVSWDTLTRE